MKGTLVRVAILEEGILMIKDYIIKKTNRETLFYKCLDQVVFNLLKIKAKISFKVNGSSEADAFLKQSIRRVHLGCGSTHFKGFLNTDAIGDIPVDITKRLPFNTSSIDLLYSSNLIEHIYLVEFKKFLKESLRVLKDGGEMIIVTPSISLMCKSDISKAMDRFDKIHSNLHSKTFSEYMNFTIHLGFGHKYLYDSDLIVFLAEQTGFKGAKVIDYKDIKIPEIVEAIEREKDTVNIAETILLRK